ncbi:hypothetical protein LSM04_000083 [Trypanosoma melophagium]|uniref:uncharacterized protein n=1 Tax=Trypanosoma melophagium TaxID=715481 RepID=UPI00351A0C0B|nr:hypothetical protein LSM04_000083 [Trypanosoma melophagium]
MSELYLEYAPEKLLTFIQNPLVMGLNWRQLAKTVENRKMFRKLIYIVGKTGNDLEAVRMAIRCMKSVSLALEYIKDNPNKIHLWNSLVTNVIQSPILIGDFLDAVEDFTIVEFLLKSIPKQNRLNIDRIGPRLNKALRNKWCTERIDESSVDSMLEDNYTLLALLRKKVVREYLIRYYTRLHENEGKGFRQTIHLGKVPVFGFLGSTMPLSSYSSF